MALTPYPGGDYTKENPSILVSNDNTTWIEPPGITNPISGLPPAGFFADCDLFFDNNTLYCIWQGSNPAATYITSSTDGVTWSAKATITVPVGTGSSPAIVKVGNTFYMYSGNNTTIVRSQASAITGPYTDLVTCTVYNKPAQVKHMDVIYSGGYFYAYLGEGRVFGLSSDGITWNFSPNAVWTGAGAAWSALMYRGTLSKTETGFDFWYSACSTLDGTGEWHIGFTTIAWEP